MKRYAIVRGARDREEAAAYLPGNYRLCGEVIEQQAQFNCVAPDGIVRNEKLVFVIEGTDYAGWTLDDYVIPRYGSGSIACEEIDLSHPVMKFVAGLSPRDLSPA